VARLEIVHLESVGDHQARARLFSLNPPFGVVVVV
jgi:hypothetical protein